MNITYDPNKDTINQQKHGISLKDAEYLEWDDLLVMVDSRRDYGEERLIGFGYIGNRVYCVVFVGREHERRIISLRKANSREIKRHVET